MAAALDAGWGEAVIALSREMEESLRGGSAGRIARGQGAGGERPVPALAVLVVIGWGLTGPAFGYSDTWQLVINTGTTIVTFLMVFLIQNTQNRDSRALQLKIDELIRTSRSRNWMVGLEDLSDEELDRLHQEFQCVTAKSGQSSGEMSSKRQGPPQDSGRHDTNSPVG